MSPLTHDIIALAGVEGMCRGKFHRLRILEVGSMMVTTLKDIRLNQLNF